MNKRLERVELAKTAFKSIINGIHDARFEGNGCLVKLEDGTTFIFRGFATLEKALKENDSHEKDSL